MIDRLKTYAPKLAAIVSVGTLLAILAPYETGRLGVPWIWVYWTGLIGLGWVAGDLCGWVLDRYAPDWPRIPRGLVTTIVVTLPVTLAVALIQFWLSGPFPLYVLPMMFFFVWVISAAVVAVSMIAEARQGEREPDAARALPALTEKLPHRLRRATLLALAAEDHYLRVHTDAGDALILMRLSDAIAAVEALDGARTHRSWWVARNAVERVSRGDGRAVLTLSNGLEAPVSRTYAPALREAGWY